MNDAHDRLPNLRCFDLDGCVTDSAAAIADGMRHALDVLGRPMLTAEQLRAAIGPPLRTTFAAVVRAAGHDPNAGPGAEMLDAAVTAYRTRYEQVGFDLTRPVDGMVALLERLRASEVGTTVLVTAKPTAVAEPLLRHLGLAGMFDAVYGAPMGPDVEEKRITLARALRRHATSPQDAIMIGDRSHDVLAGRSCGTRTVGVLWGAGDRPELEQAGADLIVAHPDELAPLLVSSGSSADR